MSENFRLGRKRKMPATRSVIPIPPSYRDDLLSTKGTKDYVKYLCDNGAKTLMTTAGTSQFNLLSKTEIEEFNRTVVENASVGMPLILGVPAHLNRRRGSAAIPVDGNQPSVSC